MSPNALIRFLCPCQCGSRMVAPLHRIDTKVRCPQSGQQVTVPKTGDPFGRKQWEACPHPRLLRAVLRESPNRMSARKLRLAVVAVAASAAPGCLDDHFHSALRCAEAMADGEPHDPTARVLGSISPVAPTPDWRELAHMTLHNFPDLTGHPFRTLDTHFPDAAAIAYRDVFPNPFRQPRVLPAWRTSSVLGMAHTAYADRNFGTLPVLADALEEAGCTELPLLDHLRGVGPHFRGCWAVDAILGHS